MRALRQVLHATDFSRASRRAFEEAVAMTRRGHGRLLLVHVLMPPSPFVAEDVIAHPTYEDLQRRARAAATRRLDALLARARGAGVRAEAMLLGGLPFEEITRFARRRRADVIVIGTHGRTGVGRFVMGSVAAWRRECCGWPRARCSPRGGVRRSPPTGGSRWGGCAPPGARLAPARSGAV